MSANTFRLRPLSDLFEIDKTQISKEDTEYSTLPFIGLENIESHSKRYLPELTSTPEGLCNRFSKKHLLYGKLRPYLNKVYLPDFDGKCSTEILPLLPKNNYSREFISIILQSQTFIEEAVKHSTGGRMPRANLKHLLKLKVSAPEAEEANIIANNLQSQLAHIETMRQAAVKQKEATKALQSAILREVFPWQAGESLPAGWRWNNLGNLVKMTNGVNSDQTRDSSLCPITRIETISFGKIDFNRVKYSYLTEEQKVKYLIREGDILFSHINSKERVGNLAIAEDLIQPIYHGINLVKFTAKNFETTAPKYLYFALQSKQAKDYFFENSQDAINQSSINQSTLSTLQIPLPENKDQQDEIVAYLERRFENQSSLNKQITINLDAINSLPAAILREAFSFGTKEN